jgi:hypothetical protein
MVRCTHYGQEVDKKPYTFLLISPKNLAFCANRIITDPESLEEPWLSVASQASL